MNICTTYDLSFVGCARLVHSGLTKFTGSPRLKPSVRKQIYLFCSEPVLHRRASPPAGLRAAHRRLPGDRPDRPAGRAHKGDTAPRPRCGIRPARRFAVPGGSGGRRSASAFARGAWPIFWAPAPQAEAGVIGDGRWERALAARGRAASLLLAGADPGVRNAAAAGARQQA